MINIVFTTGNSVTGIVRHIGKADNFRRLLKSIDNFSFPHSGFGAVRTRVDVVCTKLSLALQSWRCSFKVDFARFKVWTLFVQSCRCPCKVDVVRTKCEHYSYKVVVVLPKLTLFVQSFRRSLHKVDVVCTKFCTKKEERWQVNIDIKTASYKSFEFVSLFGRLVRRFFENYFVV